MIQASLSDDFCLVSERLSLRLKWVLIRRNVTDFRRWIDQFLGPMKAVERVVDETKPRPPFKFIKSTKSTRRRDQYPINRFAAFVSFELRTEKS